MYSYRKTRTSHVKRVYGPDSEGNARITGVVTSYGRNASRLFRPICKRPIVRNQGIGPFSPAKGVH